MSSIAPEEFLSLALYFPPPPPPRPNSHLRGGGHVFVAAVVVATVVDAVVAVAVVAAGGVFDPPLARHGGGGGSPHYRVPAPTNRPFFSFLPPPPTLPGFSSGASLSCAWERRSFPPSNHRLRPPQFLPSLPPPSVHSISHRRRPSDRFFPPFPSRPE